jgi:hypothetical protein
MGKELDKQGREAKNKKKVKLPGGSPAADVQFRHHAVPTPAEPAPKAPE